MPERERKNDAGEVIDKMTVQHYIERTGPRDIECELMDVHKMRSGVVGTGAWVVRFTMIGVDGHVTAVYFPEYGDAGEIDDGDDFRLCILTSTGTMRSDYFYEWIKLVVEHQRNEAY